MLTISQRYVYFLILVCYNERFITNNKVSSEQYTSIDPSEVMTHTGLYEIGDKAS